MKTKTPQTQAVQLQQPVEAELPIDLDDNIATTRPPDQISLPTVQTQPPSPVKPLEQLAQLGRDLAQVRPIEPPPKPAPKVHQRPKEGFD